MIYVVRQPEPTLPEYDFNRDVRQRGKDMIRQRAGLEPNYGPWRGQKIKKKVDSIGAITKEMVREFAYWTRAMPALYKAYHGICAYDARYIELIDNPTTDHFVPLDSDIHKAHDWHNYRLAGSRANSLKSDKDVLDPFLIKDGWFAIDLYTYKTIVGPKAPPTRRKSILATIKILKLDGTDLTGHRTRQARLYFAGKMTFSLFRQEEPFLANEIRRLGALLKTDR